LTFSFPPQSSFSVTSITWVPMVESACLSSCLYCVYLCWRCPLVQAFILCIDQMIGVIW
jgi:hypothetical protein